MEGFLRDSHPEWPWRMLALGGVPASTPPLVLLSMTLWGCLGNILFPETKGLGGPCSSHTLQTHDRSSQAEKQPGRVWLINWWGSSCSWLHGSNSFSSTELGSAFLNILVLWGMTQPVSHPIRMGAFNVFSASVFTESPCGLSTGTSHSWCSHIAVSHNWISLFFPPPPKTCTILGVIWEGRIY